MELRPVKELKPFWNPGNRHKKNYWKRHKKAKKLRKVAKRLINSWLNNKEIQLDQERLERILERTKYNIL